MAVLSDVVVSVMDIVFMLAVVRCLMMLHWLVDGVRVCLTMGNFMRRESMTVIVAVGSMISVLMDWVVDFSSVLVGCHLRGNVKDVVRQLMIVVQVVVIVVNDMSFDTLVVILSAIVILIWDIMELTMLMVNIVSMHCMMIVMLSVVCILVMAKGMMFVGELSFVSVVVSVVLSISMVLVMVVTSLVSVNVSWTILVVMGARVTIMVSFSKDLVETVGSAVAPTLSVAGVRAVAVVMAIISPMVNVVLSLEILIEAIIVSFMAMVHVMMEELIIMVRMSTPVMFRISMVAVPVVVVWHIPMLIGSSMVLCVGLMVVSWLSTDWGNVSVVMIVAVQVVMRVWLHFEYQITLLNIRLRSSESSAVGVKCGIVTLVPSVRIKHIEIVFPVEIKATSLVIVGIRLYVIKQKIPGHVLSVQALTPGLEGRGPEVHHD